jgi:hypothetical protein
MSHRRFELLDYANQQLMDEFNELCISIKTHLFDLPVNYLKPTSEEIDNIMLRIMAELKKDAKPTRRY